MAERKVGTVKWFNATKLNENDKVEFSVTQGPKGLQAADVKIIR